MAKLDSKISKGVSDKYKVNKDTQSFAMVAKDNPKDRIKIEIGDTKDSTIFHPQVKVMRWDNEVNFSMRAEEKPEATVETDQDLIKYVTDEYDVIQYDKPNASEDGGFEFEWILKQKPNSNILKATIQTKGLDFFYQPALTQEEIDQGYERPENVVGSYAVYHKTKGGINDAAGMEYKVGKAFHIYRPKVTDANNNSVWGELNIDEQKGELTVTIDQTFLDNAVYPVVVDPTFGYTSAGAGTRTVATDAYSYRTGSYPYNLSGNGTVTSLTAWLKGSASDAAVSVKLFINSKDSGGANVHNEIISAASTTVSLTTTAAEKTINTTSTAINAGDYILSVAGNDDTVTSTNARIYVATDALGGSGLRTHYINDVYATGAGAYATVCQSPLNSTMASGDYNTSIYATYTAAVTTAVKDLISVGVIAFPR